MFYRLSSNSSKFEICDKKIAMTFSKARYTINANPPR